jgi:hypothetical protein
MLKHFLMTAIVASVAVSAMAQATEPAAPLIDEAASGIERPS